jgi:type II secretory pathway component PulF
MIKSLSPALPILIAHAVAAIVVLFVLLGVVPGYIRTFEEFDLTLPAATKLLISMSDVTVQYWYGIVPLIALADVGVVACWQQFLAQQRWLIWAWFGFCMFVAVLFFAFAALALYVPTVGLTRVLQ